MRLNPQGVSRSTPRPVARRHSERGYTLLELTLVIGVVMALSLLAFQDRERAFYERSAQQLGMDLYQYNNAVRAWLSTRVGDPGDPAVAAAKGTYNGVGWLKSDRCDDGEIDGDGYLNCGFAEITRLGDLGYTTVISDDADDFSTDEGRECVQSGGRICAETRMDPLEVGGEPAPDLAGLAALTASGGAASNLIPTFAATDAAFNVDVTTARIVLVAGQNGADDVWLRTAGDNRMAGPVSWINDREDPASGSRADHDSGPVSPEEERELRGVSRIYNFADADLPPGASSALTIGRASLDGTDPANGILEPGVVIDADQEVLGDLEVRGTVRAEGAIASETEVAAPIYFDRNASGTDTSRFVDPNSDSALETVNVHDRLRSDRIEDRTGNLGVDVENDLGVQAGRVMQFRSRDRTEVLSDGEIEVAAEGDAQLRSENADIDIEAERGRISLTAEELLGEGDSAWLRYNDLALSGDGDITTPTRLRGTVDVSELFVRTRTDREVPLEMLLPSYVHMGTFAVNHNAFVPNANCGRWGGENRIHVTAASQRFGTTGASGSTPGRGRQGQTAATAIADQTCSRHLG